MSGTRVLVADDHPTFARTLSTVLRAAGLQVVGIATNGEDAVALALDLQPDVVLMDVHMPKMDGIEATARIVDAAPHLSVVVLTMLDDDESVFAALQAGARGYVVNGASKNEIVRAVESAMAGEAIFGAAIARRLRTFFAQSGNGRSSVAPFPSLTVREREVLDELAAGRSNAEIGRRLSLSEKTVRNYASAVFLKLHVASRSEAIVKAREAGLGRTTQ